MSIPVLILSEFVPINQRLVQVGKTRWKNYGELPKSR